ncbi:MAG: hypothetical protein LBR26_04360 [Prevotella sp.]|nr:hypothetical protein [Prevotella sp.]
MMTPLNKIRLLLSIGCLTVATLHAQVVREIEVSGKASYTDHISLQKDASDKDLMVKFVFDEAKELLTVSLISYRSLFVFREDAHYRQIVNWRHRLKPDKLPYVVQADEGSVFELTRSLRKSLENPRKKYVFRRWIEYDGLHPAPMAYRMVNDYIEQPFNVLEKGVYVSVALRDILLLDESKKSRPLKRRYELSFLKDLDRMYRITIRRDPCFGKEEETEMARKALNSVRKAFHSFVQEFGINSTLHNRELADLFDQMKELLNKQFPRHSETHACEDTQRNWDAYNACSDSISQMSCHYEPLQTENMPPVDADYLLAKSRLLDQATSRYLLTQNKVERQDLILSCQTIIHEVTIALDERGLAEEAGTAMEIYRKSVNFYKKNCVPAKTQR